MQNLTRRVSRKELADSGALYTALQEELVGLLAGRAAAGDRCRQAST